MMLKYGQGHVDVIAARQIFTSMWVGSHKGMLWCNARDMQRYRQNQNKPDKKREMQGSVRSILYFSIIGDGSVWLIQRVVSLHGALRASRIGWCEGSYTIEHHAKEFANVL